MYDFYLLLLCAGGCVGKSIIQRERKRARARQSAESGLQLKRAQVLERNSTFAASIVSHLLQQQQGEYKQ